MSTFAHGIYKDARQATGYQWFCPSAGWRFAISRAEVECPFIYCPGCGDPLAGDGYEDVLEGCP